MILSGEARFMIGVMLITLPTIEFGGYFLLSRLRRQTGYSDQNGVQGHYFRAGHAHAGVLLILAMLAQILVDAAGFAPLLAWAVRAGFALAPILFPIGYFLGAPDASGKPKPLLSAVILGGILLAISTVVLGVGLIASTSAVS